MKEKNNKLGLTLMGVIAMVLLVVAFSKGCHAGKQQEISVTEIETTTEAPTEVETKVAETEATTEVETEEVHYEIRLLSDKKKGIYVGNWFNVQSLFTVCDSNGVRHEELEKDVEISFKLYDFRENRMEDLESKVDLKGKAEISGRYRITLKYNDDIKETIIDVIVREKGSNKKATTKTNATETTLSLLCF